MSEQYLIAHDLGTSGVKAALTDLTGRVLAASESRYQVYYSPDGGAEQDPEEWWAAIVKTHARDDGKSRHPAHPGGGHEHGRPDGGHRTGG